MENTKDKTLFLWSYLWGNMDFFYITYIKIFWFVTKRE